MNRIIAAAGLALAFLVRPAVATTPDRYTIPRACTAPSPERPVCLVERAWTADEASQRLGAKDVAVFADGDVLTVIARRAQGPVQLCCSIVAPLTRIDGSDLWILSVSVFALDRAIVDIEIQPSAFASMQAVYYGSLAPKPPAVASLAGRLIGETISSKALGEPRRLTIYLPPGYDEAKRYPVVYMADGFAVTSYAAAIEAAIAAHEVRPLIVVGIWPGLGEKRGREYLPGRSVPRYAEHMDFVLNEVLPFVEAKYAPAARREDRLIAGFSDGAAWALSTALRHKEIFGGIVSMSLGWQQAAAGIDAADRPKLFLGSGLLEADFSATTYQAFRRAGYGNNPVMFDGYTSGHALVAWQSMLLDALRWFFPGDDPKK